MAARRRRPPSESAPKGNRQNRRREISGILLLAGGLFAAMSLVSMQVGGDPLMGPGGGADRRRGSTRCSASAPIW